MYLKFHRCLMQIIVIMSSEKGSCYYAFMETQRQTPQFSGKLKFANYRGCPSMVCVSNASQEHQLGSRTSLQKLPTNSNCDYSSLMMMMMARKMMKQKVIDVTFDYIVMSKFFTRDHSPYLLLYHVDVLSVKKDLLLGTKEYGYRGKDQTL